MAWCIAVDCSHNTFSKTREKGICFCIFAKSEEEMVGKYQESKNPKLSHQHFENLCFQNLGVSL